MLFARSVTRVIGGEERGLRNRTQLGLGQQCPEQARRQPVKMGTDSMKKKSSVVISGAGPTGLMLAGELALAKIDVAIVERRPNQELAGRRAGGLHSRTIEVPDQRGIRVHGLDGRPRRTRASLMR
jgi:hypothetical protein